MKQSKIVAFLLTVLSATLILLAATVFLYQGQQTLLARVADLTQSEKGLLARQGQLEQELANRGLALTAVEATRIALSSELETANGQLTSAQQQAADLTVELHQANSQLSQMEARLNAPPEVELLLPADGQIFSPDEAIDIVVVAHQATAVLTLTISIDDEELSRHTSDGRSLLTVHENWQPPAEGQYTIRVESFGVNGTAGEAVSITIEVVDILAVNERLRAQIEANVVTLRGLDPLRPVTVTLLTTDQLRERLATHLMEEITPEKARDDTLVYVAFDFLAADFDLYGFLLDLYSEQVAGFYDPETAEFVVVSDGEVFDLFEQWTYAHEYVHALQDQHFGLASINDETLTSEQRLALRALAEGEATLIQLQYLLEFFSQAEVSQLFATGLQSDRTILEQAPPILSASLSFPYEAGFEFVSFLYSQGGWAAIDAAWATPPQSTSHILHPARYLAGETALAVSLPPLTSTLGAGWRLLEEDILGEFYLRQYLGQQLAEQEVSRVTTGWGGDRYAVYSNDGDELVMVLRLAWNTVGAQAEFATAYAVFAGRRSGANEQSLADGRCWAAATDLICLYELESETVVVRAPDAVVMSRVAAAVNR
jgi:hypothetical protein